MAAEEATAPAILRPIPRRTFEITPASSSSHSSRPTTPPSATESSSHLSPNGKASFGSHDQSPSRTRSILNLTSSTLFGIYSPTGYNAGGDNKDEPTTPWGTGALTPSPRLWDAVPPSPRLALLNWENYPSLGLRGDQDARGGRSSLHHHHNLGFTNFFLPLAVRTVLLFLFGVAYGIIITHLHDDSRLVPVKVEGINRSDWRYLVFWGVAGIGLGSLLPWIDIAWENRTWLQRSSRASQPRSDAAADANTSEKRPSSSSSAKPPAASRPTSADWTPVIRSVGAFVGIAFAIRKLPWQSTLQVSLSLALVNPFLWYLLDRSKPGFLLSLLVGLSGTTILSFSNSPSFALLDIPGRSTSGSGSQAVVQGSNSAETVAMGTWVASVLFCSCICFGSVGRRLASSRGTGIRP